jgi:hypothetical protein
VAPRRLDRPSVPDMMPFVNELYRGEVECNRGLGSVGGHLHIVLDDGNTETEHVQHCLDYALEERCAVCIGLARRAKASQDVTDAAEEAPPGTLAIKAGAMMDSSTFVLHQRRPMFLLGAWAVETASPRSDAAAGRRRYPVKEILREYFGVIVGWHSE